MPSLVLFLFLGGFVLFQEPEQLVREREREAHGKEKRSQQDAAGRCQWGPWTGCQSDILFVCV